MIKTIDIEEAKVYEVKTSGYELLDYLESDGNQYINTGIRGNSPQSIFFDVEYQLINPSSGTGFYILGTMGKGSGTSYNAASRFYRVDSYLTRMYLTLGNVEKYFAPAFDSAWHTFSYPSFNSTYSTMLYDGGVVSWVNSSTGNRNVTIDFPFFLFEENQSGTPTHSTIHKRIRRAKFTMGTTIWEFKAARRNSDDELGMLDVTHNVFYPNAGTGKFIAGEVIGHIG